MSSERVSFFYAKARECIRRARIYRGHRAHYLNLAESWRFLARDTRARDEVRRSLETISRVGKDSSGPNLSI